jgi:hypothetical protein
MSETESQRRGLLVRADEPLIVIPVSDGDGELVRYFTDEEDLDTTLDQSSIQRALALAGAWADMDWATALDDLDRIRHESQPTPPIHLSDVAGE